MRGMVMTGVAAQSMAGSMDHDVPAAASSTASEAAGGVIVPARWPDLLPSRAARTRAMSCACIGACGMDDRLPNDSRKNAVVFSA